MKSKLRPEIRFSRNTGDWEKRKLNEVAEFNPKSNLPQQFEYVDLESVVGINLISHRTENKEKAPSRAQRLAKQGDVFFQTVRPYQKNNYLFDLPFDNYVFSTGYAQMRPYINSYYLLSRIQEEKFVSKVLDQSTGTSYPAINSNVLAQIEISIPTLNGEQAQIGEFFKRLDDTIALHQQELTNLIQTKQGFLQKMFPKEGDSVPEVRFPGFSGGWELKKLGDVLESLYNGQTPSRNKKEFWKGDINWLTSGELNRSTVKSATERITELGRKDANLKVVPKNTFVIAITGLEAAGTRGNCGILGIDTTLNQSCMAFFPKKNLLDTNFLFQWYRMVGENYGLRFTQGTKQQSYNAEIIKKLEICLPKIDEQIKIGKFLKKLDESIELQEKEIEALKETKKAFLQKMFV